MFWDGSPFSAESVPKIKHIYTKYYTLSMLLYEATMEDGLSVKIPTSESTDMLKQKIKIY
jgi:hypothetical protein